MQTGLDITLCAKNKCKIRSPKSCERFLKTRIITNDATDMGITLCPPKEKPKCQIKKISPNSFMCVNKIGSLKCNNNVTSCCKIDTENILFSSTNSKYPIFSVKYDDTGCLYNEPNYWNVLCGENVFFVNKIGVGFGAILEDNELVYFCNNSCNYSVICFDCCDKNIDKRLKCFVKSNTCGEIKKFYLAGFFMKGDYINFIVQIKGKRTNKIFIVKTKYNFQNNKLSDNLECCAEYDLIETGKNNCLCKKTSKKLKVVGVDYFNNEIHILTNYDKFGYLWSITLTSYDFIGAGMNLKKCYGCILELDNDPVSISHFGCDKYIVFNSNNCYKVLVKK